MFDDFSRAIFDSTVFQSDYPIGPKRVWREKIGIVGLSRYSVYMTKRESIKAIDAIARKIANEFDPEKIILFGSWAWGDPTADSDVDLFVVKESNKKSLDLMREVDRIIYDRKIAVDTLVYTQAQCDRRLEQGDPFVKKIIAEGKTLYDRSAS